MKRLFLTWAMSLIMTATFAQVVSVEAKPVDVPQKMAEYPGGISALMNFLQRTLKYPKDCEAAGIEGRVVMRFVINEDGSISDMEPVNSPDERLTAEAKRVISLMPKWTPAMDKGKKVKMRYSLPITFRLPDKKQTLDKGACEEISRQIAGKKENPRGLYRLMGFTYENGTADKEAHIEQYKYCTDSTTLQLQIQKNIENGDKPEFWMTILNQDRRPLNYTGRVADKDISIFDSSGKGFKLRWHNTIMNTEYMPMGQYITELYSSDYKISPKIQRVIDLLKMHTAQAGQNKFYGCWRRVGILTKVDGMDMLMPGHQDLYQIFDKDVYLHFYNLVESRMYAYCIMRPIQYKSNNLLIQYGGESKIEWVDNNTFRLLFDRGDGTIVTELWKRSGLPERYQQAFGTNVPVYNVPANPLPNYFGN